MVRSVLVAVDDSEAAIVAARWTADLVTAERAKGNDPEAVIMTAWSRPSVDAQGIFDDEPLRNAATKVLDDIAAEVEGVATFDRALHKGHAAPAIIDEAEARDVELIVVGSRGRSPIAQVLLGSVSRNVAARSNRPVAVIPKTTGAADGPTVVGYDDSPAARAAVRWALDNCDGEIKVVSAWFLPTSAIYDPAAVEAGTFEDNARRQLESGLKEICGGTIDSRITAIVQRDDPRLAVLDPSLEGARVVLGARGHSGVMGLLLGSTVTYVAAHSPVPVIIVPPPEPPAVGI